MSATLPLTIREGIKGVGFVPRPTSWLPCTKGNSASRTPHHGSLVQRELSAAWQTEGLSVRLPIYYIEIRTSYPLRHFVTPPLTIRGGFYHSSLVQEMREREIISRFFILLQRLHDEDILVRLLGRKLLKTDPTPFILEQTIQHRAV